MADGPADQPLLQPAAEKHAGDGGVYGVAGATMMLTCWSTAAANILYPWAFGVTGIVLGPALQLCVQGLTTFLTVLLCDAARRAGARTLAETGHALAGPTGALVLELAQVGNQLLWLPVAVCYIVNALQCLVPAWSCNIHVAAAVLGASVILMNVARDYTPETAGFAACSVVFIIVQSAIIIYWANHSDTGETGVPFGYWLGPSTVQTWANWVYVLAIFLYSWCPSFIAVEVQNKMVEPERITQAIYYSFGATSAIYATTGVCVVVAWGADVDLPVTLSLGTDTWPAIATNTMLIVSLAVDFVIAATIVNTTVQRRFFPSSRSGFAYFLVTAPTLLVTATLALLVPQLESISSIVAAVTNTVAQYIGPAGCLLASSAQSDRYVLVFSLSVGVCLALLIAAEAGYTIGWQTTYSGSFWCSVVGR